MMRMMADWIWRLAMLAALCWIGWELNRVHDDMMLPTDDQATVANEPDLLQDHLNALHDELGEVKDRLDTILVALARTR
jgi:hypothetical protein